MAGVEQTSFIGESQAPPERAGVYVLTNRQNLLEFLSSSLVVPANSVDKFYPDASREAPGRILLLRAPFSSGALRDAADEKPGSFPVALELDVAKLGNVAVPSLQPDGESTNTAVGTDSAIAWAPAGVLPLEVIVAAHFRTPEDFAEHKAREFENIFDNAIDLKVTPSLFATRGTLKADVSAWLKSLPGGEESLKSNLTAVDRRMGGLALIVSNLPATKANFDAFAQTLNEATAPPASKKIPRKTKSSPARKAKASSATNEGLPRPVRAFFGAENVSESSLDDRVFAASAASLMSADVRVRWRPLEILDDVRKRLQPYLGSEDDAAEVDRNFESIRALLRSEREFRPVNTGKGLDAAKALLLVLLSEDPRKLLSWDRAESGASDGIAIMAAALCGLLHGLKRLPISVRVADFDKALAGSLAMRLGTDSVLAGSSGTEGQFGVSTEGSAVPKSVAITWRGHPVLTKAAAAPSPLERLRALDLTDPATQEKALRVASSLDWKDCVVSKVEVDSDSVTISRAKRGTVITCVGPVQVRVQLNAEGFRRRLEGAITPADEVALKALL